MDNLIAHIVPQNKDNVKKIPRLLAVYGTLKAGYGNHRLINTWKLFGKAVSVDDNFYMTPTQGAFPIVYTLPHNGSRVSVELYEVPSEEALGPVDRLEGHPDWYLRTPKQFLTDKDELVEAEIYLQELNERKQLPTELPEIAEWKGYQHAA